VGEKTSVVPTGLVPISPWDPALERWASFATPRWGFFGIPIQLSTAETGSHP